MKPSRFGAVRVAIALFLPAFTIGCTIPSSLAPGLGGSIGMTHRGILVNGVEMPASGTGYRFLRTNGRHFGTARFVSVLTRAAARVEAERPDGILVLGDVSTKSGGPTLPHFSHRAGRDADLVRFAQTLEGAPVEAPGFIHYGPDGLAWDAAHHRFLRFDVEREWALVKALLDDPDGDVQWMFCNHAIEALLVEWARTKGEPDEVIWRAEQVLLEPHPGGAHDDHIHVRTACNANEVTAGCVPFGPERPWISTEPTSPLPPDADLAKALFSSNETP